jgi:hypothetical protein
MGSLYSTVTIIENQIIFSKEILEYFESLRNKETNEWVLMSDDKVSWLIMRPFIEEDSVTEEIKEYHL